MYKIAIRNIYIYIYIYIHTVIQYTNIVYVYYNYYESIKCIKL